MKTNLKTFIVIGLVLGLLCGSGISAFKVGYQTPTVIWGWSGNDNNLITTSEGRAFPHTGPGLQQAIWSLNSTGGTIYLPVYNITTITTIYTFEGISIIGSGMNETIIYGSNAAPIFNVSQHDWDDEGGGIYNLQINGDSSGAGEYGIQLFSVDHYTIKDVKFENNPDYCIYAVLCYLLNVQNCFFDLNTGGGIYLGDSAASRISTGAKIDHCQFGNTCGPAFIYMNRTDSCFITNNWFEPGLQNPDNGIVLRITKGCIIDGNRFYGLGGYALADTDFIRMFATVVLGVYNTHITNNIMQTVTGNGTFINATDVTGGAQFIDHVTITSNTFDNSADDAIYMEFPVHSVISDNTFIDIDNRGINVTDARGLVVSDNVFKTVVGTNIFITGNYTMVTGNNFYNPTGEKVNVSSGEYNVVNDNSNAEVYIENSKGNFFPPTQQGLQNAIYNLNSTNGGWVYGGNNLITCTSTIYLINNSELRNIKLYLVDNANTTLLKNKNNNNKNIKITNVVFEGNAANQPAWVRSNDDAIEPDGIQLTDTQNITIKDCTFNNITFACIRLNRCKNNIVTDNRFYNWGQGFKYGAASGSGYYAYFSVGIRLGNTSNSTISKCIFDKGYSAAIVVQTTNSPPTVRYYDRDWIISDCIANRCHIGYYIEDAKDGQIINCIASKCNEKISTQNSGGFYTSSTTRNILISGCTAKYCGNITAKTQYGFLISGINSTLSNSQSLYAYGNGINISGYRNKIIGCTIINASLIGIKSICIEPMITNNILLNSGTYGIYAGAVTTAASYNNKMCLISDNQINRTGNKGIYCSLYNMSIISNNLYNIFDTGIASNGKYAIITNNFINIVTDTGINSNYGNNTISNNIVRGAANEGISLAAASKNNTVIGNRVIGSATGIREYSNYNVITSNDVKGCTTTMTIVGASTIVRDNLGYRTESWGIGVLNTTGFSRNLSHNLSSYAKFIVITWKTIPDVGIYFANANTTATTFRVTVATKPVALLYFYWYAKV